MSRRFVPEPRKTYFLCFAALSVCSAQLPCWGTDHREEAQAFFDSTNLITFKVELDDPEYGALTERPKTYVLGKAQIEGHTWENIGIRLKGSGTFQPIYEHPSLTLKFNWKGSNLRFSGLNKLFLENSGQDATRMCKLIANGAFADAGVPAPRITQARVQLNGGDLGTYVVAEAINKDFLMNHFTNSSGNLYEAEFRDINSRGLKQDNGPPSDQSDVREVVRAVRLSDRVQRKEALSRVLDTDEFLTFLAVEMILANWDGYAFHQNNYRLYHNPTSGRMTFIPHDLDNTFFETGMSVMPPHNGILTVALLDTPEERKAFRERISRLVPQVLDPDKIRKRVNASVDRMSQGASEDEVECLHRQAALLQQKVRERLQHISDELAGARPPTPFFDSNGVARLEGWTERTDWNNSAVKKVEEEGKTLLYVEAAGGYCFASWRLPIWLPAGKYRFEGSAKARGAQGLPSQTGSGVGVRVLGGRRGSGIQGDCSRWTLVGHDFVVQENCEWVELIAELRAFSGSAWFDPETFRLMRLR
jgi:hypothetical protein